MKLCLREKASIAVVEFVGRCEPDRNGNTCVVAESCKHGLS